MASNTLELSWLIPSLLDFHSLSSFLLYDSNRFLLSPMWRGGFPFTPAFGVAATEVFRRFTLIPY